MAAVFAVFIDQDFHLFICKCGVCNFDLKTGQKSADNKQTDRKRRSLVDRLKSFLQPAGFIFNRIIDFLLADRKLTVMSFFSSRFIFLQYADSSNQFSETFFSVHSR